MPRTAKAVALKNTERVSPDGNPMDARDFMGLVGNTPLVEIRRAVSVPQGVRIVAKAEWTNPGGSVKDRAAARMILESERSGKLTRDKIILDATSGNTGIAYACIAASRGYRLRLCVPANISPERKHMLAALGADVVYTSGQEGSDGAIREARRQYESDPERFVYQIFRLKPGLQAKPIRTGSVLRVGHCADRRHCSD